LKKIAVKDVAAGEILARDVRDPGGKLLFSKGTKLSSEQIAGIQSRRVLMIYVEGLDRPADLEYFDSQSIHALERAVENSFKNVPEDDYTRETKRVALRLILERALRRGDILTKSQLNLIDKLKDLPPLPPLYQQLTSIADDPRTTGKSFSRILASDTVVSGKIAQLAASSFLKRHNETANVEAAVSLFGIRNAAEYALAFAGMSCFHGIDPILDEIIAKIWAHCLGAGIIARAIALKNHYKFAETIFIPVFFHDIGKTVTAHFCPEDYLTVENKRLASGGDSVETEIDLLGYSHTDTGRILAEKWQLGPVYKSIIAFHHSPYEAREFETEVNLSHIADFLSHSLHFGGSEYPVPAVDEESWKILELQTEDIEPILSEAETIFDQVWNIFLK